MNQEVYFHTGLSKTASTFLQHRVFPKLQGIEYIPTVKYKNSCKIIPELNAEKILVSREFDQQFEKEVRLFSACYPQAKPIVVFREHKPWIYSQYKRFVKNGHPFSFQDFIDLKNDTGRFKKQDLNYRNKIEILEHYFGEKPLVLLYEDLRENPNAFIQQILDYTGASVDFSTINFKPKHKSYSDKSVKLIRKVNDIVSFTKKPKNERIPFNYLYNICANSARYSVLYGAKLVPDSLVENEILVQNEQLEDLRHFTQEDWKFVLDYVHKAS